MRIQPRIVLLVVSPFALLIAIAYIQWGVAGLPPLPKNSQLFYDSKDAFPSGCVTRTTSTSSS